MTQHVRKGDSVMVIAGDQKGAVGEVLAVYPRERKVLVQGVNRVYRHMRPSRQNPQGGRMQKEMPVDISNVLPADPKTGQPTRVGFRVGKNGTKQRYARKSGETLGTTKTRE